MTSSVLTREQIALALERACAHYSGEGVRIVPIVWSQREGRHLALENEALLSTYLDQFESQSMIDAALEERK